MIKLLQVPLEESLLFGFSAILLIVGWLVINLLFGLIPAYIMRSKGHSFAAGAVCAMFLSWPVTFIVAILLHDRTHDEHVMRTMWSRQERERQKRRQEQQQQEQAIPSAVVCPNCGQSNQYGLPACAYCGNAIPAYAEIIYQQPQIVAAPPQLPRREVRPRHSPAENARRPNAARASAVRQKRAMKARGIKPKDSDQVLAQCRKCAQQYQGPYGALKAAPCPHCGLSPAKIVVVRML